MDYVERKTSNNERREDGVEQKPSKKSSK